MNAHVCNTSFPESNIFGNTVVNKSVNKCKGSSSNSVGPSLCVEMGSTGVTVGDRLASDAVNLCCLVSNRRVDAGRGIFIVGW